MTAQTVLVVDDDPGILETVCLILEEAGYRALQASGGEAALSVAGTIRPDLLVSDVSMPGMDGFSFCECVRSRPHLSQVPFIFLTGKGGRSDIRKGMVLGADDYLVKPFEPEELLAAVRARLARADEVHAFVDKASADLKAMVVRVLTHELRTPLSLILGYTDLLETEGVEVSEQDLGMILHGLNTGTRRLLTISEDLLLLSRLESGLFAKDIEQAPCQTREPDGAVRDETEQSQGKASARGVSLDLCLRTPGATIAVDQAWLTDITRRLVDNAIKFSKKEGGRVSLTTQLDTEFWTLEVADNGVGIRREALPWIFDAFRQADRDKMEQQGAGLGLAVVRALAEVHGGRVKVESELGKGSRFTVYLPVAVWL